MLGERNEGGEGDKAVKDVLSAFQDPKEYLPFLAELQAMKPEYQRYKINMYLEKYDKALKFLSEAGDEYFETCLGLIEKRDLWKVALTVFKDEVSILRTPDF